MPEISNHPVHIINVEGKLSPSSFIPFCEFGGNMSAMGTIIEQFKVPVCTSFIPKILYDQLCYEVDLDAYKTISNIENDIKLGLAFFMDYNEDRQVSWNRTTNASAYSGSLGSLVDGSNDDENAYIYLNTIGKKLFLKNGSLNLIILCFFCRTSKVDRRRKIQLE